MKGARFEMAILSKGECRPLRLSDRPSLHGARFQASRFMARAAIEARDSR
jgi:hypothetical protein